MNTVIIAAVARNRVIGAAGGMPWRIPGDLRRFRAQTMGHAVVMGRRTFDSIGRPLDGRRNIVITRNPDFCAAGAERADSLEGALALAANEEGGGQIFIIGGGQIYQAAIREGLASSMMLTEVDMEVEGDVYFPSFPREEWREVEREAGEGETGGIPHSFVLYERAPKCK